MVASPISHFTLSNATVLMDGSRMTEKVARSSWHTLKTWNQIRSIVDGTGEAPSSAEAFKSITTPYDGLRVESNVSLAMTMADEQRDEIVSKRDIRFTRLSFPACLIHLAERCFPLISG
ncbi:MAG: hypothetical protein EBZ67_02675 [Chitinophagia bacterium]|nr:hypothetical protein [Chitinophagia bacterium]